MQSAKPQRRIALRLRPKMAFRRIVFFGVLTIVVASVAFILLNTTNNKPAYATTTESMPSGSFIINMGVTPQTYNNGLKPYGMIYDLIRNYNVPIKWVIEPTKLKDSADFTYNSVKYKGGPFIVSAEYITSAVTTRITYWTGQGVQGVYTTSAVSVPVYATLTSFPLTTIDTISGNEDIITDYFDNAVIPSSAYATGAPSTLTSCIDLWVNPHGDPAWSSHQYLYDFVTTTKSFIWSECHAVSVMESVTNPNSPYQQLNFLTSSGLKCYSSGDCGSITETHAGNPTGPYTHDYPADPVMQFMSTMNGATNGGSEEWYQPLSTGQWNSNTKLLVTTSDGSAPRQGILMAYGPAYNNPANGYVMYTGGHNIDNYGSTTDRVAAQRAFFNFLLLGGIYRQIVINNSSMPATLHSDEGTDIFVNVSGGTAPYTYAWTTTISGGSFTSTTSAATTYTSPTVTSATTGTMTATITDACGRRNFVTRPITVYPGNALPISLVSFKARQKENTVHLSWATATETNNDFFTIEKSIDAASEENWTTIATIRGAGNSTSVLNYEYQDMNPLQPGNEQKSTQLYYRLKQTDYDGKFTYFPAKAVLYNSDGKSDKQVVIEKIGPNPFSDILNIDYTTMSEGEVKICIFNMEGATVYSESKMTGKGFNHFSFNGFNTVMLPSGIYYVNIILNGDQVTKKIMKT